MKKLINRCPSCNNVILYIFSYKSQFQCERLEKCASTLYEAFATVRQENGLGGKMEIGMQDLTNTIKHALVKYGAESKEKKYWIDLDTWIGCVKRSGYIDSEVSFQKS
ncbi:hypothetical protein [Paenibacillus roseipurpureus]|uniref:Uncharacterized protein n=1 Tax=Paenibacillus roseopurpureus TaxID=2918901 RepID=A0AA96LLV7_9BACL|nr:hypothetical protein [Paenibacillus sp. MBLB1832]WNR43501.1 hypothetical protein MJB10_20680 [Paenibacillus sp. MBLB1832]